MTDHETPDPAGAGEPSPRRRRRAAATPSAPSTSSRSRAGRRSQRRRERRREVRRQAALRGIVGLFAVVAVGMGVTWAVATYGGGQDGPDDDLPTNATPGPSEDVDLQAAWVIGTFDEAGDGRASLVTVLAHDREDQRALVVLVPATLLVEVPGHGLQDLGEAFAIGGAPLLEVTLANVLGVDFDGAIGVSEQDWSAVFTRIGGLDLDVEAEVVGTGPGGDTQVRFRTGVQHLDGPRASEYLTIIEPSQTELQRFPRVQQVLETLLGVLQDDPSTIEALFADGAPMLDTSQPDAVRALLADMAAARAAGDLQVRGLPVTAVGSGTEESYRPDAERVEAFVADQLAGSVPDGSSGVGRRVQILNGNGIPGIGQAVAERLQPGGFRIIDSGNHANFNEPTTRILVFSEASEVVAAAERARDLLGVGAVFRSEVPLGVADIVIIVGADFTADPTADPTG